MKGGRKQHVNTPWVATVGQFSAVLDAVRGDRDQRAMLSATECGARSATWREQAKRCCGTRSQPDHNPFRLWTASAGGLSSLYYVCYHFLSYPLRPDPFALATLARSVSPALSHYPLLLTGFLCVLMVSGTRLAPRTCQNALPRCLQ